MNYSEFLKTARQKAIKPVYLLVGNEPFLVDRVLETMEELLVPPEQREFNVSVFHGDSAQIRDICLEARTQPFLGECRLVIVRNAAHFARLKDISLLIDYAQHPAETACLVLEALGLKKEAKLFKELSRCVETIELASLKARDAATWVRNSMKNHGKLIPPALAQEIVDVTGTDLAALNNQVEALASYLGTRDEVTPEDLNYLAMTTFNETIFDLTDAVGDGRPADAVRLIREMLAKGENDFYLVTMIEWQLRRLYQAKALLAKGKSFDDVCKAVRVMRFLRDRFRAQVEKFSLDELAQAYDALLDVTMKMRTTGADTATLLETYAASVSLGR